MLPPPTPPSERDPFAGSGRRAAKQWAITLGALVLFAAVVLWSRPFVDTLTGNDTSTSTPQRFTEWRWEGGNCDESSWPGRFYNLSNREISGRLWAILYAGDVELDRDYEVIANLPAGSSEGVEFAFFTDRAPTRCIIDGFDLYP